MAITLHLRFDLFGGIFLLIGGVRERMFTAHSSSLMLIGGKIGKVQVFQ